jgi:membrane dipeptidase
MNRRSFLATTTASALAAPFLNLANHRVFAASERKYSTRAVDLMRSSLVIDMLAPLFLEFDLPDFSKPLSDKARAQFKSCGITGFHNSTGIGGPNVREDVEQYFAGWSHFCGRNTDVFSLVGGVADLDRAKREDRIAVILGIQNAEHFRAVEDVALFYAMGQRCSQLTYNSQTLIGSGSTEREDGGLSDFGVGIVEAMNKTGMLVDVSHCGDRTTLDAIQASKGPIAVTHSNCRVLNNHPRCKTDEAIRALAAKGGVMGITGVRFFVSAQEPTTIENIVDHIDHVIKLVGIEHVGIGSDSDLSGYDAMSAEARKALRANYNGKYPFREHDDIEGFNHAQKCFDLTEAMIRRGYSNSMIQAVLGANFRRLLGQVWL